MKPTLAFICILLCLASNTTQCQKVANPNNTLPLIQLLDATDKYIENRGPALLAIEKAILTGNVLETTLIGAGLEEIKIVSRKIFKTSLTKTKKKLRPTSINLTPQSTLMLRRN